MFRVGRLRKNRHPDQLRQRRHSLAPDVSREEGKADQTQSPFRDGTRPRKLARGWPYSELIFARNSPFDFVLLSLSISNSIASTG